MQMRAWQQDLLDYPAQWKIAVTARRMGKDVAANEWVDRQSGRTLIICPNQIMVRATKFRHDPYIISYGVEDLLRQGFAQVRGGGFNSVVLMEAFRWSYNQIVLRFHREYRSFYYPKTSERQRAFRRKKQILVIDEAIEPHEWDNLAWQFIMSQYAENPSQFRFLAIGSPVGSKPKKMLSLIEDAKTKANIAAWHVPVFGNWSRTTSEGRVEFPADAEVKEHYPPMKGLLND